MRGSDKALELWGGIECTVNRVGNRFFDQVALSGHSSRLSDLDRFAELGINALRYPVLWERVAPKGLAEANWEEIDRALERLRELRIKPIIGLVHHGSGPRHTSLLDNDFPLKLAEFARAVATRYPWLKMFTPINEPLTTARFAGLYGHWYPHARDDRSFVRAVINQCLAIRASMNAIREVIPGAELVQTEDLGKTYSTAPLAYQATFDNTRRWLTFDLLSGRLDEWHPLWWYLLESGAERAELDSFLAQPCVPDLIGVNHYLTSERFLDHRVERYPDHCCGGNGRHSYADVEAVRVLEEGIAGHRVLLGEAWDRYRLPIAITEVHLGCTREHQLRWLAEAWDAATALRAENVDVRAVTVWSMLGCYGWSSLLTRDFDDYEPGVFDLRSPSPRPTALAEMVRSLSRLGRFDHPVLHGTGWWRDEARFSYGRAQHESYSPGTPAIGTTPNEIPRPILITGCRGTLGEAFRRVAIERGLHVRTLDHSSLDIADRDAVRAALAAIRPWAVINAAGYVRVDDAESEIEACWRTNTKGALVLGEECRDKAIKLVSFSSDLVFSGDATRPYTERDPVSPLNAYGRSKAAAEAKLLETGDALIIRTSAFFGPWDSYNFVTTTLSALAQGTRVRAAVDTIVSPTYVPDLVDLTLDLLIDGERGIWHLANRGEVSWAEFARLAARAASLDESLVVGMPMKQLGLPAARPVYCVLGSERGTLMPSLDDAIRRYFNCRNDSIVQTSNSFAVAGNV
ncbi:MAG: family 1 glycosylhydrolase [Gemmatimonadaceae bacterium]